MATFFRTSRVWVVEFTYDGHPRRWLKALPESAPAQAALEAELAELYGQRARLVAVRPATAEEETQYIRGDLPKNAFCPTGLPPARRG
jgi:hypothetical protein